MSALLVRCARWIARWVCRPQPGIPVLATTTPQTVRIAYGREEGGRMLGNRSLLELLDPCAPDRASLRPGTREWHLIWIDRPPRALDLLVLQHHPDLAVLRRYEHIRDRETLYVIVVEEMDS